MRRRLLANPLSNSPLPAFEPVIQATIGLAMEKVRDESRNKGYADVYTWLSLMATDAIEDLTFRSSFRVLERGEVYQ